MEIEYLPVYKPSKEEAGGDWASSKLFAKNVRAKVAEAMDVPCTEHSYEDVRLAGVAAQLHLPANDAMIEIGKAKAFLGEGVTLKTIEKHLNAFAIMDVNKTGEVTFEQFAEALDLSKDESTGEYNAISRNLFDLIDHNGSGVIHFKDYLFGLALVNETPGNRQQLVKLAFSSFEREKGGGLGLGEFSALVSFNPEVSSDKVREMFVAADADGDGMISYKDFNKYVQDNPKLLDVFSINFLDRSENLARKGKWRPSVAKMLPAVVEESGGGIGGAGEKGGNIV
jgi:lysophosphatidylcholine acyltransferase/lyso-PAF acetyltransferase